MKNLYVFAVLCISVAVLSSFKKETGKSNINNAGAVTGTVAFPFCSGDYVVMDLTDNYEIRGVQNNNRAMVSVKHHFTGTGTSILTGESFTMDTEIESHANLPVSRGAMVLHDFVSDDIKGSNGSLQAVVIKAHQTYNGNGIQTANRFDAAPNCH